MISLDVKYKDRKARLDLLMVAGDGPSLMGRDWLGELIPYLTILHSSAYVNFQSLLRKYSELFNEELGLVKGLTVKLQVDVKVQPQFYKPRTVPYALRSRVEEELVRLEREGILEPVTHSEWAAPVVPLVKQDGSVRLCGDYKLTIN